MLTFALQVALPNVADSNRFEVHHFRGGRIYAVTCLYGFRDTVSQDRPFVELLVRKICEDIRYRAMVARYHPFET